MKPGSTYVDLRFVVALLLGLTGCGGGGGGGGGGGTSPATTAPSVWSGVKQLGVAGADTYARGVATDASGSVFVVGRTDGNLDGSSMSGNRDLILTKYSGVGARQYIKQLHASSAETSGSGVATDTDGNVYVAGYTYGDLDGNTRTAPNGQADLVLIKYNSGGARQYTKQLGAAGGHTEAASVAVDSANRFVYVVGHTMGGLNGNALAGTTDAFLAQYTTAGTLNYVGQLGVATKNSYGQSVAVDALGNVYVAGYTDGGLNGNTLTGTRDAFLAQYTSAGTLNYVKQLGLATTDTYGEAVAIDASGNVYVVGETTGGLNGNTLTGTQDAFLAQYTSAGTLNYVEQLGVATTRTWATGVTTDASGHILIGGETTGGLNGSTLTGTTDAYLAQFTSAGTLNLVRQLGAAGTSTWAKSVAVDASGNAFLAGSTNGGLNGNALAGIADNFVAKYSSSGTMQ